MGVVEDVVARVGAGVPAITLRPATNPATATTPTATTAGNEQPDSSCGCH